MFLMKNFWGKVSMNLIKKNSYRYLTQEVVPMTDTRVLSVHPLAIERLDRSRTDHGVGSAASKVRLQILDRGSQGSTLQGAEGLDLTT